MALRQGCGRTHLGAGLTPGQASAGCCPSFTGCRVPSGRPWSHSRQSSQCGLGTVRAAPRLPEFPWQQQADLTLAWSFPQDTEHIPNLFSRNRVQLPTEATAGQTGRAGGPGSSCTASTCIQGPSVLTPGLWMPAKALSPGPSDSTAAGNSSPVTASPRTMGSTHKPKTSHPTPGPL